LSGRRPDNSATPTRELAAVTLLTPGEIIDERFQIIRQIGSGAMGSVLQAVDLNSHRVVALKVISPEFAANLAYREQFMDEARALARVRHYNVVSMLEFGVHQAMPFFVMEYIDGGTLRDWLTAREEDLAVDEALGFLRQICEGVQAIHDAGVVHRDLKPSNVLIGPGFRVAVADLGLARSLDPDGNGTSGSVAGTLAYLPPEIALAEIIPRELMPRSDVYSVAVMAYELLTGQLPYTGTSAPETIRQRIECKPPLPTDIRPTLPPGFDGALLAALVPDPGERTPTAKAFFRALSEARPSYRNGHKD
jgi:serine/threonine-protein kinase